MMKKKNDEELKIKLLLLENTEVRKTLIWKDFVRIYLKKIIYQQ